MNTFFDCLSDLVSNRATCDRLHVGAVLVRDRMIISAGYNGSPRGISHCDDIGHRMVNGHCVRTIHGEINAVIQAAYHGISTRGTTLYTNYLPCEYCAKILINARVERIVYRGFYKNIDQPYVRQLLRKAKVRLVKLPAKKK